MIPDHVIFCFGFLIAWLGRDNPQFHRLPNAVENCYLEEHQQHFVCLLKSGVYDVNQRNGQQNTALHTAAEHDKATLVKLLLSEKNIDPTLVNDEGDTPLQIALRCGAVAAAQVLLEDERLTNVTPEMVQTLFRELVTNDKNVAILPLFFETLNVTKEIFNAKDKHGCSPFFLALQSRANQIHELMTNDKNVAISPLFFKTFNVTKKIFNAKDEHGCTPFFLAVQSHANQMVNALLRDERMDLNSTVSVEMVRYDGEMKQISTVSNETLLLWAIKTRNLEAVTFLVGKEEVDVNVKGAEFGLAPLHIAVDAYQDFPQIFEALFYCRRTNVNVQDAWGNTFGHRLLNHGWPMIHALGKNAPLIFNNPRVRIDIQNNSGTSLLSHAINCDSISIFTLLIDRLRLKTPGPFKVRGEEAIPDPEVDPTAFALHPLMENASRIKAYYAALSILKNNRHLTEDEIFEQLEAQEFPGCQQWTDFEKAPAFQHAQNTLAERDRNRPSDLFAEAVFLCDGLLEIKPGSTEDTDEILARKRFFRIMQKLPMELQMEICKRVYGERGQILAQDSESAFQRLVLKL